MFAGSKSYYLYGASSNELEIYQIVVCGIQMMKSPREHGATTFRLSVVQIMSGMKRNIMAYGTIKKVWGTC